MFAFHVNTDSAAGVTAAEPMSLSEMHTSNSYYSLIAKLRHYAGPCDNGIVVLRRMVEEEPLDVVDNAAIEDIVHSPLRSAHVRVLLPAEHFVGRPIRGDQVSVESGQQCNPERVNHVVHGVGSQEWRLTEGNGQE